MLYEKTIPKLVFFMYCNSSFFGKSEDSLFEAGIPALHPKYKQFVPNQGSDANLKIQPNPKHGSPLANKEPPKTFLLCF